MTMNHNGDRPEGSAPAGEVPAETQMEQHDFTADEQINGLVAQTHADAAKMAPEETRVLLQQRLSDAGINVSPEQLDSLTARVTTTE